MSNDKRNFYKRCLKKCVRRKIRWMQRHTNRRVWIAAIIIVGSLLLASGGISAVKYWQQMNAAKKAAQMVEKKAKQSAEELRRETAQIKKVIDADTKYGAQLKSLYEKYPQMKKLFLNREKYPDWLLDYFMTHEEAVDWVVDYPDYEGKTEAEIEASVVEQNKPEKYVEQNGIPLYLQWDKTWGYAPYGTGVIAIDGCGPTCLAMVVAGLTGDAAMTPKKMADFSVENGFFAEGAGTSWSLMEQGARRFGLKSRQIERWSAREITRELKAGHPMICSMGPGDFTEQGHFIVLCGLSEEGTVILNDPNSRINSLKEWDVQYLMEQMKSMWAFSTD